MKTTISYNLNEQLWKMEGIAEAHGYTKTADCYWTQIFTNEAGDEIVACREDTSVAIPDPVELMRQAVRPSADEIVEAADEAPVGRGTLYFEGAGWSGADISKATVGNCRIRTAFRLDDGRAVYLEIIACEVTKNSPEAWRPFKYAGFVDDFHYIDGDAARYPRGQFSPFEYDHAGILALVNSLGASFDAVEVLPDLGGYRVHADDGGYNYGDAFRPDRQLITAREEVHAYLHQKEVARGERFPCYSLWVDHEDPAVLHYKNFRTRDVFDICVAVPSDPSRLPELSKTTAIPSCFYSWCDGWQQVYRIYSISKEYAAENELMYLDRVETSCGDFALPGSDIFRNGR